MRMAKLNSKLAERSKARNTPGVVLPAVKEGMLKDYGPDEDRRWDIVHPSELSHQDSFCPRAVYLRITEGVLSTEKFDFVRENIFAEGNSIHDKWQARLRKYTQLWGNWKCLACGDIEREQLEPDRNSGGCCSMDGHIWKYIEVSLNAEREALMCGHADGALLDKGSLVEFKSVGEGTVRIEAPTLYKRHTGDSGVNLKGLWQDINRPFKTHLNQGDIYMWIAAQRGFPFTQISFVYESKWNQMVKEYVVEYNEARSLFLVDQARAVMYAVEHRSEPDCRFPGKCGECKPYDARRAAAGRKRTVQVRA
jgi:hypothetical protein